MRHVSTVCLFACVSMHVAYVCVGMDDYWKRTFKIVFVFLHCCVHLLSGLTGSDMHAVLPACAEPQCCVTVN